MADGGSTSAGTPKAKPVSPGFRKYWGACAKFAAGRTLPPRTEIRFSLRCETDVAGLLGPMAGYFESMAKAQAVAWGPQVTAPATSANTALRSGELFVDLAGLIDVEAEIAKQKERERLLGAIASKEKKLANASFVERAPAEVVEAERRSLAEQRERLAATEATLAALAAQRGKKS